MLLHQFQSLNSLFRAPEVLLKRFRSNDSEQDHRTVRFEFDPQANSKEVIEKFENIAASACRQENYFLGLFRMKQFRRMLIGAFRRQLRGELESESGIALIENLLLANALANKSASERAARAAKAAAGAGVCQTSPVSRINPILEKDLPKQLMEAALDSAAATAKGWYCSLQKATLLRIILGGPISNYQQPVQAAAGDPAAANASGGNKRKKNPSFWETLNEQEKHYSFNILGALSTDFFDVLDGKNPPPKSAHATKVRSPKKLCEKIRRVFHKVQGSSPCHGEDCSFALDESCYSVIYYEELDKTEFRITCETPEESKARDDKKERHERLSLWVKGRVPIRGTVFRPGAKRATAEKRGLPRMTIRAVPAVSGWGFNVPLPLKCAALVGQMPKTDSSLICLERFDVATITGKAPARSAIPSDWLEPTDYSVIYDENANTTTFRIFPSDPALTCDLVVAGKTPARENIIKKKGEIARLKPIKPRIHLSRTDDLTIRFIEICRSSVHAAAEDKAAADASAGQAQGSPAVIGNAGKEDRYVYYRDFDCDLDKSTQSFLGQSNTKVRLNFDDHAYTVFYDEKTDMTEVLLGCLYNGRAMTIRLKGRHPLREFLANNGKGVTKCKHLKKPTVSVFAKKDGSGRAKLKVSVMLPAKAPAEPEVSPELPVTCVTLPVESYSGEYLKNVRVGDYFPANKYRAVYDPNTKKTEISLKLPNRRDRERFVLDGTAGISDYELNSDNTLKKLTDRVKPCLSVFRRGRDPKRGTPLLSVRLVTQRKCQPRPGIPTDACLDNPDLIRIMMFDFGETEVAWDALGNRFGKYLGERTENYVVRLMKIQAEHNRYLAMTRPPKERAHEKYPMGSPEYDACIEAQMSGFDAAKAKRVRKHNLGKRRIRELKRRLRTALENEINRGLNEMFEWHRQTAFVVEDLSRNFRPVRGSKFMRAILSAWPRGVIEKRMEFKAAERGVRLVFVPAAYSSQVCPRCGHVSRNNRYRDEFRCEFCGYEAHADIKAAAALGLRVHDPLFRKGMRMREIKKIHADEHKEFYDKMRKWGCASTLKPGQRKCIEDEPIRSRLPDKKWPFTGPRR